MNLLKLGTTTALSLLILTGCEVTLEIPPDTAYELPTNLVTSDEYSDVLVDVNLLAKVGPHYGWSCEYMYLDGTRTPAYLSFEHNGQGTLNKPMDVPQPFTWEITNDGVNTILSMNTPSHQINFDEFKMSSPIAFAAINEEPTSSISVEDNSRLSPMAPPYVDCVAIDDYLMPIPLSKDMFANGVTLDSVQSQWNCRYRASGDEGVLMLGLDGFGSMDMQANQKLDIVSWDTTDEGLTFSASDGTQITYERIQFTVFGTLMALVYVDFEHYSKIDCEVL